jgi:hypothetical protein
MIATLFFASDTLFRHRRLVVLMGALGLLAGLASALLSPRLFYARVVMEDPYRFHPENALRHADRDFREGNIQLYYLGGIVATAPGVPTRQLPLIQKYKRASFGGLGCVRSGGGDTEMEDVYALRYNQRMFWHLTK